MERRAFLRALVAGAIGTTIDPEELLWRPGQKTIFVPHPAQIAFLNSPPAPWALYGVPYHQSSASSGTWLGIMRSVEPLPWRKMMDRLTIDPTKPLYIVDKE